VRRAVAVVVTLGGLAGAPLGCRETPAPRPHQETPAMEDTLRALDRIPDALVMIRYGTEHFANGLITLRIYSDGRAEVEQLSAGAKTIDELRLPPERIAALGRQLAEHGFTARRTSKLPREPGDTELLLELRRGGAVQAASQIWYADRYKDRELDAIMKLVEALIHEVTKGRLGWAGR
jgi:hypothetical protein